MITGIKIDKVEATRNSEDMISNMKFNINFDDVIVNGDNVEVKYTFLTSYEGSPSSTQVGELKIVGSISSKESADALKDIQDVWKSKKTLPLDFAENVINILNFECGSRGTLIAYSIGFVAPLPLSRAKLQDQSSNTTVA
jgi:hypothetical protein